jgi:cardiolipin synthase
MVTLPHWVVVVAGLALIVLVVVLWSLKRRRRPRLRLDPIDNLGELKRSLSGVTQGTSVRGNRITLLQNCDYFDALYRDLEGARASINLETFLSKKGQITRRVAEILANKAREGVKVHVLLDGSGGRNFGKDDVRQMKDAGCDVRMFHPIELRNLGVINNRTHRKIVIIDGRIGYIGGHCLVDTWLGNAEDKEHFRDISARVEGPVVAQLQSAFAENWMEEGGEVVGGDRYFPELPEAGQSEAQVVFASPMGGPSTLKLLHYIAIASARKSITIQNPYFLPDPDARKALIDAAARGVAIRIMIPADEVTDSPLVQHASHHHYGTLLKGGVRLFDYQRTLLHQKVFTVDGAWCAVGSTNFDDRSFEINEEVSMVIFDEAIARELEAIFEADLQFARERRLQEWRKRPAVHKLKDFFAFLFNEQL